VTTKLRRPSDFRRPCSG